MDCLNTNDTAANAIASDLLERVGQALDSGDFARYASCFRLPHLVETFGGATVIATRDELREVFSNVRENLRQLQVTEHSRDVVEAQFHDPHTIHCTHETRLVTDQILVQDAIPVFTTLRRADGAWMFVEGRYALPDGKGPNHKVFGNLMKDAARSSPKRS